MFDIASTELFLVVVVALLVIGPKELPRAMRFVGKWFGKARRTARHFYAALDKIIEEAEIADLEKNWQARNEAIMREFPTADAVTESPISETKQSAPTQPIANNSGQGQKASKKKNVSRKRPTKKDTKPSTVRVDSNTIAGGLGADSVENGDRS